MKDFPKPTPVGVASASETLDIPKQSFGQPPVGSLSHLVAAGGPSNPAGPYVPPPNSRAALAIGIAHLSSRVMMAVDQAVAGAGKEKTLQAAEQLFWQKLKDGGFLQNLLGQ